MRKLAMLATALVSLGYAVPTFAQGESGPQPGLPPGASVDAPNAGQPPPSGRISSTDPTRPTTYRAARTTSRPSARVRRARRRAARRAQTAPDATAPAATAPAAPANQ